MAALARSLKGCFVPACEPPDMRQAFGGLNPGWTGIKDRVGCAGRKDGQPIRHGDQPLETARLPCSACTGESGILSWSLKNDRQPIHCAIKAPGLHVALQ
ncbi:hypothetical protein [Laribacter hongkongensis]|uniref:hypothetical protein n=1 Tax=Laribacter hongkongensis TaxID=168471 RepID=UPI00117C8AD9|nr:hypothetical protein [Laribacter hongkongensis]